MAWRRQIASKDAVKLKQQPSLDSEDSTSCTDDTNITELIHSRRQSNEPDNDAASLPMSMQNFLPSQDSSDDIENQESESDSESEDWIRSFDKVGGKWLTCLENLDRLTIRHQIELLEVFMGCEKRNKFHIEKSNKVEIFSGQEETDFCTRLCLGTSFRPFDVVLLDGQGRQVMNLSRNVCTCDPCCCCCFGCSPFLQSLDIFGGGQSPGTLYLGKIKQRYSMWRPKFDVFNGKSEPVLRIRGRQSFLPSMLLCNNIDFDIFTVADETLVNVKTPPVGKISRKCSGFFSKESLNCHEGNSFELSFPRELDVKLKAVLIGATTLIILMYFENYPSQQKVIKKAKQH